MARTRLPSSDSPVPFRELPAAALRACLREGYGARDLRADLLAGLVVGIVALPLSMALAIAVGVPPQHGIFTAIVAGLIVPLLGGSRMQVTGPTAAFVVVLAPVHVKFGIAGLLLAGAMAGVILIGMGLARMGRLLQFVPHPVTTGFTAGIAVVIATFQMKDFLGLTVTSMPEHYVERVGALALALPTARPLEVCVGVFTLAILLLVPRLTSRIPAPLIAIGAAAFGVFVLGRVVPGTAVETIGSRFALAGALPAFALPWGLEGAGGAPFVLDFATVRALLPAAFAIAMLGAIESLLSAVVADGMAGTRHDSDAELFAQGVGNLVVPFFGGIACTGAIARTATNIRSGGRSPIACAFHAVVILAAVLVLSPALRYIPMASLAALLLVVAWRMSEAKHFAHIARVAPRSDVVVLLTCFVLTVVFDMVIGVSVGIVLAALLFMRRMAEVSSVSLERAGAIRSGEVPPGVVVYRVAGPLFFGAAGKAMSALGSIGGGVKVVVLELADVPVMDATGLVAFESALDGLAGRGVFTVVCAVAAQPAELLRRAHIEEHAGGLAFRPDLDSALELARDRLAASPGRPVGSPVSTTN